ncbi:MAG TPA: hypothetical protein VK631_21650 [Solirubrobacteraceae bacterium]|nr:hypothetical protein [Solirubrobacteraceae bacterium]
MRDVLIGYAMLQYGGVMPWGRVIPNADGALMPSGEGAPPLDYWLALMARCETTAEVQAVVTRARDELAAWRRRPTPPPAGESLADLKRRIVEDGEGWTPQEVALAMRVTPTLVRNTRIEAEREVEHGRPDGSLVHGLQLLAAGLSLRQVERITGIPKSTLHDARRMA